MKHKTVKKVLQLGVVLLGASVVAGCPSQTVSSLLANSDLSSQDAIAQEAINEAAPNLSSVTYEVCADVENWQRPSQTEQAKHLAKDIRYASGSIGNDALKSASKQFWDHQVISFTTYGLSARMEPENFSGVWTAVEDLNGCYAPENTVAINEGDRAETWLLNQEITDLAWVGDRYIMTVEPAATGLQVIQFDRTDERASLPLEVVTAKGDSIEVVSGDWQ